VVRGVKFRLGPSSALSEKVASGLVWRFGTFDCISDNLAHFKNGFGNSGSFLDVGSHRFYVAKPFLEEVTDVLDSLCDGGLSYGESSNLGAMVEVMALEKMRAATLCAPSARRPNAFFHRSKMLHSQSRTPRTSPWWTCVLPSAASSIPPGSPRPWSGRVSSSSARWLRTRPTSAA
jgi:hypothetical protein